MDRRAKIYVAGHAGLVGGAIIRSLSAKGYANIVTRSHTELDLTDPKATRQFFQSERPQYVFLAAAKVGGILANSTYPADFIRDNLLIQSNVIQSAYETDVDRLLFLGSSCIYPKQAPQPLKEEYLLTGPLETTNRPYAVAKIAGIEMCWSYNRQYGTRYLSVMPTNLYGPGDNYDPENSHVIPALIRKFSEAKTRSSQTVTVWGTGTPRREFLYSDDMAQACIYLMNTGDDAYRSLLSQHDIINPPLVNIGYGTDVTIEELARAVAKIAEYEGKIVFDASKPDGTPQKLLDSSRIRELGWRPKVDLEQGLRLALEDFKRKYSSH